MEILTVNRSNVELLEKFIELNNSKHFTYFNNRTIDVLIDHVITIIGVIDNNPIAYGHIDLNNNINWIGLCVLEKFHTNGYGKQILKYLLNHINNNEITNVKLTVNIDNYIALNMYLKNNFIISNIENKFYVLDYEKSVYLPVSLGEALDKLTILDIKLAKIQDDRNKDVKKEYDILFQKLEIYVKKYSFYYDILKKVNLDIWEMQDDFRYNNGDKVKLCIKIIEENDCRFRIKKKINNICNSVLKEQKGYNMKKAFILTHLGLGDIITSISMVRYLSTIYDEVLVVCKNKSIENVKLFYNDDCSIKILGVDNDNNISPKYGYPIELFKEKTKDYDLYMCGFHNLQNKKIDYKNIPYSFYKQLNIPVNVFWDYFHIPTDLKSLDLYNEIKNQKYVFVHNKASNGIVFSDDLIKNKLNINKDNLLFINPDYNFYDKTHHFFELANKFINHYLPSYVDIIKNAHYNILTDSSFFCLAMQLEINEDNNYYISRNNVSYEHIYKEIKLNNKTRVFTHIIN